jgi:NADPH-dependent 2,4-dienoyl-CoA reductase/sulfur reductase-like enzyme
MFSLTLKSTLKSRYATSCLGTTCRGFAAAPAGSDGSQKRIVIVGGVAGGATAAARAMRLNNKLDVTVVERSPDVSFANCGLPYYIGREITDRSKLALQTPESLSATLGIKVLTQTDVFKIDRKGKTVSIRNLKGDVKDLPYDTLILSPGASPLKPPVAGINDPRVLTLRNLQDMDKIDAIVHQPSVKRVAVIGAGFIGLEVVEQLHRLKKKVHLVEKAPAVLPQTDEEMAEFLHAPLIEQGIDLIVGDGLTKFESVPTGLKVRCLTFEKLSVLLQNFSQKQSYTVL